MTGVGKPHVYIVLFFFLNLYYNNDRKKTISIPSSDFHPLFPETQQWYIQLKYLKVFALRINRSILCYNLCCNSLQIQAHSLKFSKKVLVIDLILMIQNSKIVSISELKLLQTYTNQFYILEEKGEIHVLKCQFALKILDILKDW